MKLLRAALLAAFLLPLSLAGQVYNTVVFNRIGQPVAGASVVVCTANPTTPINITSPCGANLATLYTDQTLGTPGPNPVSTDGYGNAVIFAQPGIYWTVVYGYLINPHVNIIAVPVGSGGTPHNLLSSTHPDTVPYTPPVLGDLIVGNGSGKWQVLHGNNTASQYCLVTQGNGTDVTSVDFVACPGGAQNATYQKDSVTVGQQPRLNFLRTSTVTPTVTNNPGNTSVDVSFEASTPVSLPPPFTIPAGQAVAFAYPSTCFAYEGSPPQAFNPSAIGTLPTDATIACGTTGGVLTRYSSGPLHDFYNFGMIWGGFTMPTLPVDAVIQHVYPVSVASISGPPIGFLSLSCSATPVSTQVYDLTGQTNVSGYYSSSTSLGSTSAAVTTASCGLDSASSTSALVSGYQDDTNIIALAIYYTTATPPTNSGLNFYLRPSYGGLSGLSLSFSAVADGSPISFDAQNNFIKNGAVALNHATTTRALNVSNMQNGGVYALRFVQDSTGGATVTLGTGCNWIVNNSPTSALNIPLTANAISQADWIYDGTNCFVDLRQASSGSPSLGNAGVWAPAPTTYTAGQIVSYSSCSWIAVTSSSDVPPGTDNGVDWTLLACNGTNGSNGTNGTNGTNGAPGVPGYSPNQVISGGGVAWTGTGLNFVVSPTSYFIGGVQYSCPLTGVTLTAADPALDRIDAIICNTSGVATFVTGTASATPVPPTIDITSQLQLTFVYVAAGATIPSDVSVTDIYHENAEWTCTVSGGTVVCNSSSTPHSGSLNIKYTAAATNAWAQQAIPSGSIDLGQWTNLVVWIRNDVVVPSTRSLVLQWFNSTTAKCSPVTIQSGNFGYNASNITTWQQLVIPTSTFACSGIAVTALRETVGGSGTNLTIHLDDITLQGGLPGASAGSFLTPCGDWNNTATYPVNCVVFYSVTGSSYQALQTNTNKVPTNSANWKALDTHGPAGVDGSIQVKSGANFSAIPNSYTPGSNLDFGSLTLRAYGYESTDTVDNTMWDFVTGSGGDSTCPAPLANHNYFCNQSGVPNLSINGAAYSPISVAAGAGTVTSFSAGMLSPIFTTSVATATTTPALSFILSNAGAHSFLGNNTGSSAAPTYVQPNFTDLAGSAACSQQPALTGGVTTSAGTCATSLATRYTIQDCEIAIGDPGSASPALANDNDTPSVCANDYGADYTITAVSCTADAGSPTVTPILSGGTSTSIVSGAITCGTQPTYVAGTINGTPTVHSFSANGATCSSTPCTVDGNITAAGGTAKYIVIKIKRAIVAP
jgi:hypothetical protein